MSKNNDLNYTYIGMLVIIGLVLVAVSGVYVALDNQKITFGESEKELTIFSPEGAEFTIENPDATKFDPKESVISTSFNYSTFKGLKPKFFHEYSVSYYDINNVWTVIIKFLIEGANVEDINVAILYPSYSSALFATYVSPIYYDALNNPLQDAYIILQIIPD